MKLNQAELTELNSLLKNQKLDLPSHKREVRSCGSNFNWLHKNLMKRNPDAPVRLKILLGIEAAKKKVPATEVEGG